MASENGAGASTALPRLLVDWGGVMTSNVFDTFRAFCELEGLEPDEIGRRFREDRACRELLIGLETGALDEEEFEPQFAAMLGVERARADRPDVRRLTARAGDARRGARAPAGPECAPA